MSLKRLRTAEARAARLPERSYTCEGELGDETLELVWYEIETLQGEIGDHRLDLFAKQFVQHSTNGSGSFEIIGLDTLPPFWTEERLSDEQRQRLRHSEVEEAVNSLRRNVFLAAEEACAYAHQQLVDLPKMKVSGRLLNEAIECARVQLERIAAFKAGEVDIREFLTPDAKGNSEVAQFHLEEIIEASASLQRKVDRFYSRFHVQPVPNANIDPFPHEFIRRLALVWTDLSGEAPSSSKSSRFVKFVTAAWLDFDLERGPDARHESEIEPWMAELVAKHPCLSGKTPLENI